MERSGKTIEQKPVSEPTDASNLVTALVTALKNIAIYPASHPRVTNAAAEFVASLQRHCGERRGCLLVSRGDVLLLDDVRLPLEGAMLTWITARFREAGLRGVEITADCATEDVLHFATVLNQSRARTGTTFCDAWKAPNKRLVPLPLVFQGHHDANATVEEAEQKNATVATDYLTEKGRADARIRAVIDRLAATEPVQARLRSIARHSRDELDGGKKLDLYEVIAELLPADVSNDTATIEEVVQKILARVDESISELVRRKARVKGADLLRKAMGVARRYFHTSAPQQTKPTGLPSGRPEDDKIVADLQLLLAEVDALPDASDLRLPTAAETASTSAAVGHELFGICLHGVANSTDPGAVAKFEERLRKARAGLVAEISDVLAAYAGPKSDPSAAGMATRTKVLNALVETGHSELIRERGFVDATFIARGFPETLPIAARALGNDERGRTILREGLEQLAGLLQAGGTGAAEAAGVLADPNVVKVLAATGGNVASQLLLQAATKATPPIRAVLRDHLCTRDLPVTESVVLHLHTEAEALPRDYLQSLLRAVSTGRFDASVRTASAALLRRRAMLDDKDLSHEDRLLTIQQLVHVPGPETESLLRELAREGRFLRLGAKARAVRRIARETLATIQQERQS